MALDLAHHTAIAPPLLAPCERAVRRARRAGPAGGVAPTPRGGFGRDPSAVAVPPRVAGEPWFCFEQPDRDGHAVAAIGCVRRLEASGERRFAQVAAAWRALAGDAEAEAPDGPPGAGLIAVGGFAFAA